MDDRCTAATELATGRHLGEYRSSRTAHERYAHTTVVASDPEGADLTYAYQWSRNGTDITECDGSVLALSVAGNGDKGDTIGVRCDGLGRIEQHRSGERHSRHGHQHAADVQPGSR